MSAPAARRLSLLAANCTYCARQATRIAPARRRNWQQTVHSSSRRWYADGKTTKPPTQASTRRSKKQTQETNQDDVAQAVQETIDDPAKVVPGAQRKDAKETNATEGSGSSAERGAEPVRLTSRSVAFTGPISDDVDLDEASSEIEASVDGTSGNNHPALQDAPGSTKLDTGIPEGAVLTSEQEEEGLEDILGTEDAASQEAAILAAIGGEARSAGIMEKGDGKGFWTYAAAGAGDAEYLKDNVTSLGHDELEQQREYREYARLAAWELPLLSKLAKPFVPPTKQQPLRFRYTSYLGEEHPAASKVVLEFDPSDLPGLTEIQKNKLIKLLGVRYNPSTHIAKMSCESQDSQAQNKRYLLDRLSDLLAAARDPADTFEDVPFDFRHHKPKKRHEFPQGWIVTEERLQQLVEKRRAQAQIEDQRKELGSLVDGKSILERVTAEPQKEPQKVIVNRRTGERVMPQRRA